MVRNAGAQCLADAAECAADPPVVAALALLAASPLAPFPGKPRWEAGLCAISLLPLSLLSSLPTVAWGADGRRCLAVCAQLWLHRVGKAWPDLP